MLVLGALAVLFYIIGMILSLVYAKEFKLFKVEKSIDWNGRMSPKIIILINWFTVPIGGLYVFFVKKYMDYKW